MEADSRRDEIETFFTDYKGEREKERERTSDDRGGVRLRILAPKSNQPHDVINNATSGIAPKRDESRVGNMPRPRQRSINLREKQR